MNKVERYLEANCLDEMQALVSGGTRAAAARSNAAEEDKRAT